jgi:hypothetical protein
MGVAFRADAGSVMVVAARRKTRGPWVIGSVICLLAVVVTVDRLGNGGPDVAIDVISGGSFSRIVGGMRPAEVEAVLGRPAREVVSLAEGYAWPEPPVTCWYYASLDATREYQVCFIEHEVTAAGSYLVQGGESP